MDNEPTACGSIHPEDFERINGREAQLIEADDREFVHMDDTAQLVNLLMQAERRDLTTEQVESLHAAESISDMARDRLLAILRG